MFFTQLPFLAGFLPVTWLGFHLLRARPRLTTLWLVAASLVFYATGNSAANCAVLGASILFNYLVGRQVPGHRTLLVAAVTANLLLLTAYKLTHIPIPLGISFFTFVQIAYLIERHSAEIEPPTFDRYALMITFFPKIIAGPIVRPSEFLPKIGRPARTVELWEGAAFFAIGLAKKLTADQVSLWAAPAFSAGLPAPTFFAAWSAVLAYTVQIYLDFSGYSDMAIGIARWFGFRLPVNFNTPYRAASIIDFWRRWHISLTKFLTDYVFFGLPGNRKGPARRHANLMITMVLCGLWHGLGWTFAAWGALHGAFLVLNHLWRAAREQRHWPELPDAAGRGLTLLAVIAGWIVFASPDWRIAHQVFRGITASNGITSIEPFAASIALSIALLAVCIFGPNSQELVSKHISKARLPEFSRWWLVPGLVTLWLVGIMLSLTQQNGPANPFIYAVF